SSDVHHHDLHSFPTRRSSDLVVVIAVQTVLRPMLDRGIRPDFVTALDYHEISTRFYEGLTREDLEGITLVAEPKVNPAVLDAFRSEEHTSELQSRENLVCRLL